MISSNLEPAMPGKILLTRPRVSSQRWAALLTGHGFESLIEPLLTIVPTDAVRPAGAFAAVMISSASALDALEDHKAFVADLLHRPCFCVGAATAEAARQFGFTTVTCGASDGVELAELIVKSLPDPKPALLHIAGDVIDGKAQESLARHGVPVTVWTVYQAQAAADFSIETVAAFKAGAITTIPVFSPRSARILIGLIEKNRLAATCARITAIGLSQPVADVLQTMPWRRLLVAATPCEDAMLACLQSEPAMPQTESLPPSAPPRPVAPTRRKFFMFWAVAMIALGIASAYVVIRTGDLRALIKPAPQAEIIVPVAQIQNPPPHPQPQPQIAAPSALVASAPANSADIASLTDSIRTLQADMIRLRRQTAAAVAIAVAFGELREQAASGRSFAAALAALRAAAAADPVLIDQSAALQPYAAQGVPTWGQLQSDLAAQEGAVATEPEDAAPDWLARIKNILRHLVSVRPAHPAAFTALENALQAGDAAAALADFDDLPAATRQALATWHERLQARLVIDRTLATLSAHLTAPPAEADGNMP